jgi:hypothetical protein
MMRSPDIDRAEARDCFKQSALRAWTNYKITGLHVTYTEADA